MLKMVRCGVSSKQASISEVCEYEAMDGAEHRLSHVI
jgi:hypothetical protein